MMRALGGVLLACLVGAACGGAQKSGGPKTSPTFVDSDSAGSSDPGTAPTGTDRGEQVAIVSGTADGDADGTRDDSDLCPADPEDKDGFEDADGCPDPDNDKDGILDADDTCPNEAETYNGHEDEDGCPDKGTVIVKSTTIEIIDNVWFASGKTKIDETSVTVLDAVAATLKGNPQVLLLELQGHTDALEAKNAAGRQALAQERADAVKRELTNRGVEATRLKAQGYGDTRPVTPCKTADKCAPNRRVEFVILKKSDD